MTYKKIWNKTLAQGERVEYEFSLSSRYLNLNLILWGIVGLATVWIYGLGFLIFLSAWLYYGFYLRAANAYAFTNKRILIHRGWLSTSLLSVDFSQVTDVHVAEHVIERWFLDTGRVSINTAGTAVHEIVLTHISNPYGVKQKLVELMNKDEQTRRFSGNTGASGAPSARPEQG